MPETKEDNVATPEETSSQQLPPPPIFANLAMIKKTLAEHGHNNEFKIEFTNDNIAGGCEVLIKDKRQTVLAKARTVVPGRPIINSQTGQVCLEVFFSNLRILDAPDQDISIIVNK